MESQGPIEQESSRPYRSHKIPACNTCRRRKIRCEIDISGEACQTCRKRNARCEFSTTKHQAKRQMHSDAYVRSRSSVSEVVRPSNAVIGSKNRITGRDRSTSPEECDTLFANPTMAEDLGALEPYITSQVTVTSYGSKPFHRISKTLNQPIMCLPVPQRRPKPMLQKTVPGKQQREIMDHVLGASKADLIKL